MNFTPESMAYMMLAHKVPVYKRKCKDCVHVEVEGCIKRFRCEDQCSWTPITLEGLITPQQLEDFRNECKR